MAGQLGNSQVTIRKLMIVRVDAEQNLLLIKGAIPGKPGALVNVMPENKVGR
jgi:large subunit ribosomal protein L3